MSEVSSSQSSCVLVVDDEPDIRETLREVIEMAGCTAITAKNGKEALALLANEHPCLIILDLLMPVMTGIEVLESMRTNPALSQLAVVVSTSAPHLAPAGVPILEKPIDIADVWQWMSRTCQCRSPRAPHTPPAD
jgi:CheY-like chemotaxis protein